MTGEQCHVYYQEVPKHASRGNSTICHQLPVVDHPCSNVNKIETIIKLFVVVVVVIVVVVFFVVNTSLARVRFGRGKRREDACLDNPLLLQCNKLRVLYVYII